jgi:hypothetical protein
MTEEEITDIAVATKQIKNLCDSINALVDEKHKLMTVNDRMARELKACIAEKGELQKQLALKSSLLEDYRHDADVWRGVNEDLRKQLAEYPEKD